MERCVDLMFIILYFFLALALIMSLIVGNFDYINGFIFGAMAAVLVNMYGDIKKH